MRGQLLPSRAPSRLPCAQRLGVLRLGPHIITRPATRLPALVTQVAEVDTAVAAGACSSLVDPPATPSGPAAPTLIEDCTPVATSSHPISEAEVLTAAVLTVEAQTLEEACTATAQEPELQAPPPPPAPVYSTPAAKLDVRFAKAHAASLSALLVVSDNPTGERLLVSASLDKSVAYWKYCKGTDGGEGDTEVTRVAVKGGPVFSLAKVPSAVLDASANGKKPKIVYCGTANKDILFYNAGSAELDDKVKLNGHTGWVRSLSISGKYLFSCGCNFLKQWDTTFSTPKECRSVKLFTGDILEIASSRTKVFTCGADGSVRSWDIWKTGELTESAQREKGHDGRVASCVYHGGLLYTASYDGSIKAWNADTLELMHEVRGAHDGTKVYCVRVGADGIIYSGGDDNLLRAWTRDLQPVGEPLQAHGASVRVISVGKKGTLISGDSEGDICVWTVQNPLLQGASQVSSL